MESAGFIAIEGIDGAGKRTQIDLLARLLAERGIRYAQFSFPRYDSFFGKMVGQFLNGDFGEQVDAHFSALLYAGDRLEARAQMIGKLADGETLVVADRYIGSNLAHQTARVPAAQREAFLAWLKRLEYEIYDLPREDAVIYLRVPAAQAQKMVGQKAARKYTAKRHDILEADLFHLEEAAKMYDQLAAGEANWLTIECFDAAAGAIRPPEEIHRAVIAAVEKKNARLLRARGKPGFRS